MTTISTSITLTLPAANEVGAGYGERKTIKNTGTGTLTVIPGGSDIIYNGQTHLTSLVLRPGESNFLQSDGVSGWHIVPFLIPTIIVGNNQTGTSYTLVLSDAGKVVECNNASAIALTIPPVSSVAWPVGTVIEVWQQGAGVVTLTPGSGVTLLSDGSKTKTAGQYATVGLRMRSADTWILSGDLST